MSDYNRRIDLITGKICDSTENLSFNELNIAQDESWSIAKILDHIIILNSSYFPTFEAIRDERYKPSLMAKFPFLAALFGKLILKTVEPDRKNKTKTMKMWEPGKTTGDENIIKRFQAHQEELKVQLDLLSGKISSETIIGSPANRNIVYSLEKAIEIIITHEERHAKQIIEIVQSLEQDQ